MQVLLVSTFSFQYQIKRVPELTQKPKSTAVHHIFLGSEGYLQFHRIQGVRLITIMRVRRNYGGAWWRYQRRLRETYRSTVPTKIGISRKYAKSVVVTVHLLEITRRRLVSTVTCHRSGDGHGGTLNDSGVRADGEHRGVVLQ